MKKDLTLVIMAAGMGSRFGGLKQIEPVGPNGEFILDYSIYDAIKAGFNKVVFIIKKENYDLFRETVGKRIEGKIKCEYAFQDINDLPEGFLSPSEREKPWGTGHAILSARNLVKENFAVINADDFYSYAPYKLISDYYTSKNSNDFLILPYLIGETISETGAVKRGICKVEDEYLTSIIESSVIRENGIITASPLNGSDSFAVTDEDLASMNVFGFTPEIFSILEKKFIEFLNLNKNDLTKCEYLISEIIQEELAKNNIKMKSISHTGKWFGITYKEDKELLVQEINKLISMGEYPQNLWN